MDEFVTLDNVSAGDIFPNFGHLVLKALSPKKNAVIFSEIVTVMNRTSCRPIQSVIRLVIKQIRRPRILSITRMITDRIGLNSVLLPLLR